MFQRGMRVASAVEQGMMGTGWWRLAAPPQDGRTRSGRQLPEGR